MKEKGYWMCRGELEDMHGIAQNQIVMRDGNSFDITCEQKVFIPSKRINEDKYYTKKIIIKD